MRLAPTFIGRFIVPAQPGGIGLTDREDGQVYVLSSLGDYVWVRPRPRLYRGPVFDAWRGPEMRVGRDRLRLLLRGARLGYEVVPPVTGVVQSRTGRVMTKRFGRPRSSYEVLPPEVVGAAFSYMLRIP